MPVRVIQSKQNPRLKELRRALAAPCSPPAGLVGIEGPNLVAEALRAGLAIDCLFAAEDAESLLAALPIPAETEILLVPRELLSAALTTENPQPIAALVAPPAWDWQDLFRGTEQILVLAGLQDPGNLGTILRSAEAFGSTGIVALPGTVSPWNPKAVRASAGSVFRVPLVAANAADCFARLRAAGVTVFTTAVHEAKAAHEAPLDKPFALLIGNEGNGVPAELAAQADAALTIPCPGPVESLNAAVAAGILLYEASRQRSAVRPVRKGAAR